MKKKKTHVGNERSQYINNLMTANTIRAEWQNKKTLYGQQPFSIR